MEEGECETEKRSIKTSSGRRSLVSAVSTESGIHMGSDHDTGLNSGRDMTGPELLLQTKRLTKIIKSVRRSQSYNVCDVNKNNLKNRRKMRPKSLVHGWEDSAISVEELYLWQSQLRQLHNYNKQTGRSEQGLAATKGLIKVPKKESLREKAKTLLMRGLKNKKKHKQGSMSSSCTEDDPDSTSSSLDRSYNSTGTNQVMWSSKDTCSAPDLLRILKVFAGPELQSNVNAEYRAVLATADSSVLELKKQSLSKYGFVDSNPAHYTLVCSTGFYSDKKGNTISTPNKKGFGSLSERWREIHAEKLNDTTRPLEIRSIREEMETTRFELRYNCSIIEETRVEGNTTGLHHYPTDCPFLILIQGYDKTLDHVIYPLIEGESTFVSLATTSSTFPTGSVILVHTPEILSAAIVRTGGKCVIITGLKRENLKCGESFYIGKHYKFLYREAIDNAIPSPVGSPDTQRTLSTGTLTSVSPDHLNNLPVASHEHAEPRFVFYMEHKTLVFDHILHYDTLAHKNALACAQLTIMALRHALDFFDSQQISQVVEYCKNRLGVLAKVVQDNTSAQLLPKQPSPSKKSGSSFLRPMVKLLASTLEIVHFLKESGGAVDTQTIKEIELLAVPMFEHVAFHSAKMVYELLPSLLEPVPQPPPSSPVSSPRSVQTPPGSPLARIASKGAPSNSDTTPDMRRQCPVVACYSDTTPETNSKNDGSNGSGKSRRWSLPGLIAARDPIRKRRIKDRPRSESMNIEHVPPRRADMFRSVDGINNLNKAAGKQWEEVTPCRRDSKPNLASVGPGVKRLVHLLQKLHALCASCKLNSTMTKQLFVSIFYFSNTTLFNTIMESPLLYFNWNKGIQLRVHLDFVLRWAHHSALSHTANLHLKELSQLLDLLSLPKRDLLASSWTALARTFPDLSPAQLHHVLSHYRVAQKPRIWRPAPPLSLMTSGGTGIRVELTSYPALVIPSRGYKLSSSCLIPDSTRPLLGKLTKLLATHYDTSRTLKCTIHRGADSRSIGLKLKRNSLGSIVVSEIVPDSPARLGGCVECEDEILQINEKPVSGTSVAFCKKIIQECEGSVCLLISRRVS